MNRLNVVLMVMMFAGCGEATVPSADGGASRDAGFDAGTDGGADLGQPDLGHDLGADAGRDLGAVDAGADLGQPDLGADAGQDLGVDLGQDAGEPDLGTDAGIDLGADLGADMGPSCTTTYGGAFGYRFCAERAAECEFYAVLGGLTGNARCATFGGTCISTYDSNPSSGDACRHGAWLGCGRSLPADAVVVCSR